MSKGTKSVEEGIFVQYPDFEQMTVYISKLRRNFSNKKTVSKYFGESKEETAVNVRKFKIFYFRAGPLDPVS